MITAPLRWQDQLIYAGQLSTDVSKHRASEQIG